MFGVSQRFTDIEKAVGELEENESFYTLASWTVLTLFRLLAAATIREWRLFRSALVRVRLLFESGSIPWCYIFTCSAKSTPDTLSDVTLTLTVP